MKRDTLSSLVGICGKIDERAVGLYGAFASLADPSQQALWRKMADDERRHVTYWRRLAHLLPEIADQVLAGDDEAGEGEP